MENPYSRRLAAAATLFLLVTGGPLHARAVLSDEPRAADHVPDPPRTWPRLHVPDPVARDLAQKALEDAWVRLADRECAALLTEFSDSAGLPLVQRLGRLSVDPQTYLTMLVFVDGSREATCVAGVFGFTMPGSRVVRLCVDGLKETYQKRPREAAARFIHEALHTLGLGENPPSSKEITERVLTACYRRE